MSPVILKGLMLGVVVGTLVGGIRWATRGPQVHASPSVLPTSVATASSLVVPARAGDITIDGEFEDDVWSGEVARTGGFQNGGAVARPYSDIRMTYGNGTLYLLLYAADEDIRVLADAAPDSPLYTSDAFTLGFRTSDGDRLIDISAAGVVTDARRTTDGVTDFSWSSNATIGTDRDGTPNDPSDQDEEWVLEVAIPLSSLGLHGVPGEHVEAWARRCDDVRGAGKACGAWGTSEHPVTLTLGGQSDGTR